MFIAPVWLRVLTFHKVLTRTFFKKKAVALTQSVATGTVHIPTEWDKSST